MPEVKDALLRHYRESRDTMLATVEALSDELMIETSLDGWSIKDHPAHLALWDEIRAAEVARIAAGNESVWRMSPEQEAEYNRLGYDLRRGLSLAQVRWEYEQSRQQLIAAIEAANERALDGSNYGEATLKSSHEALHAGWIRTWRTAAGI